MGNILTVGLIMLQFTRWATFGMTGDGELTADWVVSLMRTCQRTASTSREV